jgi:hypothetical protein
MFKAFCRSSFISSRIVVKTEAKNQQASNQSYRTDGTYGPGSLIRLPAWKADRS